MYHFSKYTNVTRLMIIVSDVFCKDTLQVVENSIIFKIIGTFKFIVTQLSYIS